MTENNESTTEVNLSSTEENLPLETFIEMIESGDIEEEIPFEFLSTHYPSLLDDWYPGYPCELREMTPDDPICLTGIIKDGTIEFKDMPEAGSIPFDDDDHSLQGEHKVWLQNVNDELYIHVVPKSED